MHFDTVYFYNTQKISDIRFLYLRNVTNGNLQRTKLAELKKVVIYRILRSSYCETASEV